MSEPEAEGIDVEALVSRLAAVVEALERRVDRLEAQALADQLRSEADKSAQ